MQRDEKESKYSKVIILVCNIYDEKLASPHEKKIIEGVKQRYKNVDIIYLHYDDTLNCHDKKFEPLEQVDNRSLIYIVGHCSPGSDSIKSDPVYEGEHGKMSIPFSFVHLSRILLENISNPAVVFNRDDPNALDNIVEPHRKLKVVLATCNAALDSKGKNPEKSFAHKFFNFIFNQSNKILNCDLVAANAFVYPIGSKSDLKNTFLFITRQFGPMEEGFHKRYFTLPLDFHGNYSLNPMNWFLSHKPNNPDYKLTFVPPLMTSDEQFQSRTIQPVILNVEEEKERMKLQSLTDSNEQKTHKKIE